MRRHGFGGLLSDEQWRQLISMAPRHPFSTGQALLNQGDTGQGIHLMISGRVRVVSVYADGTAAPLAFRARGEILGESVLAGGGRTCSATVTALSGGSTVYLSAERFQSRLRELGLVDVLWDSAFQRQDESDRIRVQLARLPAERRLPAALVHLAAMLGEPTSAPLTDGPDRTGEGRLLHIPLPQLEVGGFAGLSRTSVHHAYTQLKELGLIRTGRQYVVVVDLGRLEALALGADHA
ncbi:Crp/Fnr family transcriptional regulator [Nocardiopsis ganjiahuensis]|uniref:Crp/Fnr family transcriptional regulator n=1 Tax=Nocardiopsis ganjiahuensis TaxID=239984 RepID=UPI00034A0BDA|nr:Crp/Fnr family transcriptional regulator [Nocardiopsis ganjiahuensis]